jgi:hypothetical protein
LLSEDVAPGYLNSKSDSKSEVRCGSIVLKKAPMFWVRLVTGAFARQHSVFYPLLCGGIGGLVVASHR